MPPVPVGWITLAVGVIGALLTLNAIRPLRSPLVLFQSMIAAWLVSELALHHLAWQLVAIGAAITFDALATPYGIAGVVLLSLSSLGAWRLYAMAREAAQSVPRPRELPSELRPYPKTHLIAPLLAFLRRDIRVSRGVEFSRIGKHRLRVDVFEPKTPGKTKRPAVVQIHGGGWVVGFKWMQGIPLLGHLCSHGWVAFNVDYRLSPRAKFPDHLVDVKQAIAWIREHADDYGIDPDFIVVTGGSAGGHLAAMVALTPDDPTYQPGFEDARTDVMACVPLYGVYDLVDQERTMPGGFRRMLEMVVMGERFADASQSFEQASPVYRVHEEAPPFFVVHGTADTVVSVKQARNFVARLEEVSDAPVVYVEMPGAAHAFDIFPSVRTLSVVESITAFLLELHRAYLTGEPFVVAEHWRHVPAVEPGSPEAEAQADAVGAP